MPPRITDINDHRRVVCALDRVSLARLRRMALNVGRDPAELAADLLRDILADDEAAEGLAAPVFDHFH